jgi:hypothetical protein
MDLPTAEQAYLIQLEFYSRIGVIGINKIIRAKNLALLISDRPFKDWSILKN